MMKKLLLVGKETNRLLARTNRIITITNIINAITILALIFVILK